MIAVYMFEHPDNFSMQVVEVSSSDEDDVLVACKLQRHPPPIEGTELVFIENDKAVVRYWWRYVEEKEPGL